MTDSVGGGLSEGFVLVVSMDKQVRGVDLPVRVSRYVPYFLEIPTLLVPPPREGLQWDQTHGIVKLTT
jgi:hypothetical protein